MKIVNVEDFFIPDAGYQINVLPKYLAKFGHTVYIVTSEVDGVKKQCVDFFGINNIHERDDKYTKETGVKIIRIPLRIKKMISGRIIQSKLLFDSVEQLNPDIVFVHGNDSLTGIRYIIRKNTGFALITDSHMLPMASVNKLNKFFYYCYKKIITPIIIKKHIYVIRTQNDSFVNKCLGIPYELSPWVSYGTDTLLFHPDYCARTKMRKKYNINNNDFVVVYTGKLDEYKGGKLLAQAFKEKFDIKRNIILLVVGSTCGEYGKEVEHILSCSQNRILRFPTQKYSDLSKFYQMSDLSIFAKQCSLSFYDAQACGLPVLSEDNNINIERCSYNNGWNFKSNNIESIRECVIKAALMYDDILLYSTNALNFIKRNYNYEDKAREYEKWIKIQHNEFLNKLKRG